MPWVGLQCVIVVFPDHTHLLFGQLNKLSLLFASAPVHSKAVVLLFLIHCLLLLALFVGILCDWYLSFGPRREKTCLRGFANTTGADQPAHPRSLISAFVVRFLVSIICKLASDEISIF